MSIESRIRVAIIDDHVLFRDALRTFFERTDDVEVVGEAGDATAAFSLVAETRPDVALLDVALPGINGLASIGELTRRSPTTRVLVVTAHARQEYASRAAACGAAGFVSKGLPGAELLRAMRAVAAGERYLPADVAMPPQDAPGRAEDPLGQLSPREREIFDLVAQGCSNEVIAKKLFISIKTVETHRAHINDKLDVHSSTDLIRFAFQRGLLDRDQH